MNLHSHVTENQDAVIGQIGWKYYNSIKKKAMEQEFSWAGLTLSLSIAFFIVIITAMLLSLAYQSLQKVKISMNMENNIYSLEKYESHTMHNYINLNYLGDRAHKLQKNTETV